MAQDLTKLPLRIRVAALILNNEGKLLIIRVKDRDIWTSLGGGIEPGESEEQCIIREINEEVGLKAISTIKYTDTPLELAAGSNDKAVKISFYLVKTKGNIKLDPTEVIAEFKWISAKDFTDIHKGTSIRIGTGLEFYAIPKLIKEGKMK